MGTIQINKYWRKVTVGIMGQERQKNEKTYGKIICRFIIRGLAAFAAGLFS